MGAQRHHVVCPSLHSTSGFKPKAWLQHLGPELLPLRGVMVSLSCNSFIDFFPYQGKFTPTFQPRVRRLSSLENMAQLSQMLVTVAPGRSWCLAGPPLPAYMMPSSKLEKGPHLWGCTAGPRSMNWTSLLSACLQPEQAQPTQSLLVPPWSGRKAGVSGGSWGHSGPVPTGCISPP